MFSNIGVPGLILILVLALINILRIVMKKKKVNNES